MLAPAAVPLYITKLLVPVVPPEPNAALAVYEVPLTGATAAVLFNLATTITLSPFPLVNAKFDEVGAMVFTENNEGCVVGGVQVDPNEVVTTSSIYNVAPVL